MKGISPAYSRI